MWRSKVSAEISVEKKKVKTTRGKKKSEEK